MSNFTVTAGARPGSLAARLSAPTRTVLVVEDDGDLALFVRAYLRSVGFDVVVVAPKSVSEVTNAVLVHQPQCILLDHNLGHNLRSGDVLHALSITAGAPPVIVVSGDQRLRRGVLRGAGARDLVRKPFSAADLAQKIIATIETAA
jgi:DNA-binding response OmpR family regulator